MTVAFCRSRRGGRRCTRELGHAGLHRHRTIMWADSGADDPRCPGSGAPGSPAEILPNGFPGGRALCPVCLQFVPLVAAHPPESELAGASRRASALPARLTTRAGTSDRGREPNEHAAPCRMDEHDTAGPASAQETRDRADWFNAHGWSEGPVTPQ